MKKREKGRRSEEVVSSGVEEKGVGVRARMIVDGVQLRSVVGMQRHRITPVILAVGLFLLVAIIRILVCIFQLSRLHNIIDADISYR